LMHALPAPKSHHRASGIRQFTKFSSVLYVQYSEAMNLQHRVLDVPICGQE
jgi:hypothetical protein